MNAKFLGVVAKAGPVIMKALPVIGAGISGVYGAIAKQKEVARIDNMDQRIKDLEALLKKD